jgi:hypothetical protein
MRRVARRGLVQASIQVALTAAVQNLRRLASHHCQLPRPLRAIWRLRTVPRAILALLKPQETILRQKPMMTA